MTITYVPLANVTDVGPGTMRKVEANGRSTMLANVNGEYFAFPPECPHEGADLAKGELEGAAVRCANHYYLFDLATGAPIEVYEEECSNLPIDVEERAESVCLTLESR